MFWTREAGRSVKYGSWRTATESMTSPRHRRNCVSCCTAWLTTFSLTTFQTCDDVMSWPLQTIEFCIIITIINVLHSWNLSLEFHTKKKISHRQLEPLWGRSSPLRRFKSVMVNPIKLDTTHLGRMTGRIAPIAAALWNLGKCSKISSVSHCRSVQSYNALVKYSNRIRYQH